MPRGDRIPTPFIHRWRRFRYQLLPVLAFPMLVMLTLVLWQRQGRMPNAVGEVEALRIDVAAATDGKMVQFRKPWDLFEHVLEDTVIAQLDDGPTRATLVTLQSELNEVKTQVGAEEARFRIQLTDPSFDEYRESNRVAWMILQHQLDQLDRKIIIETDKMELRRRNTRIGFLESVKLGFVAEFKLKDERLQREQVVTRIKENQNALKEVEKQLVWNRKLLDKLPKIDNEAFLQSILAPWQARVQTQESRIGEVVEQAKSLEVRTPITGTITALHSWPGQNIRAGDPIVTIAAEHGRYIVSYIRQEQGIDPKVDMGVQMRMRGLAKLPIESYIEMVGPQIEPIPPHHLRDPNFPEWGLPVKISMPKKIPEDVQNLKPGELIDLLFLKS